MSADDLARLRAVWPAIVRAKGGWPQEPMGCIFLGSRVYRDGRLSQPRSNSDRIEYVDFATPNHEDVPDLTLPGTRAAVLAWLGIDWHKRMNFAAPVHKALLPDEIPEVDRWPFVWAGYADASAEYALCAIERWHEEHCA